MILYPKIFCNYPIIAAQSSRLGGVSDVPFSSLNLGLSVKDDEKNVLKNRELFFGELNIPLSKLAISHQVHGSEVLFVTEPGRNEGYDAQITNQKNIYLVVSIADCTPILIYDTKNEAVAAMHAGWRGTAANIVTKTLKKMQEHFGTKCEDCKAFIGACISYENFEVGEEVAINFSDSLKRFDSQKRKWFVDLKSANSKQLTGFGILPENIEISDYCTIANNDLFFSHRKEKGITGRMMAVIGLL